MGIKNKKKKRLGFDLVFRASFHLTIPFKSQAPKLDTCLYRTVSNSGVPDSLSATPHQRLYFSNTFN